MEEINVGIDLGTTNTLVCRIENAPQLIVMDSGAIGKDKFSLKSAVYFSKNDVVVGGRAYEKGSLAFKAMKREIEDGRAVVARKSSRELDPIDFSTYVLNEALVKFEENADISNDYRIKNLIVTVPAEFNQRARANTKEAIMNSRWMDRVDNLKLIDEPIAAAIAHKELSQGKGVYLVYDLGGGTFDCSIIKGTEINQDNLIYEVVASSGDRKLGGVDFDKELGKFIYQKITDSGSIDSLEPHQIGEIKNELQFIAEKVKIQLSHSKSISDVVPFIFSDGMKTVLDVEVTREEYWNIIKPMVNRTVQRSAEILDEYNKEIDGIVFVGGSTHDKQLRNYVTETLGIEKVFFDEPDFLVAKGASLCSAIFTKGGTRDAIKTTIIDRIDKSFGIVMHLGVIEWLVPAKVQLPIVIESESTYRGISKNQTSIKFDVIQGLNSESGIEELNHNRWSIVGEVKATGFIPENKVPEFSFIVHIDENKIATFEIKQIGTDVIKKATVSLVNEIQDSSSQKYRLEVKNLIQEARQYASEMEVLPADYDHVLKELIGSLERKGSDDLINRFKPYIDVAKKALYSNSEELKLLAMYRAGTQLLD